MTYVYTNLDHLAEVVWVSFSTEKCLFIPPFCTVFLRRCHWITTHMYAWELSSTCLRAEHLHKLFGILLWEIGLFLLFDWFMHSFIYLCMDSLIFVLYFGYTLILFKLLCCSDWIQGVLISESLGFWMVLAQERASQPGDRVWCRGGIELLVLGGSENTLCSVLQWVQAAAAADILGR